MPVPLATTSYDGGWWVLDFDPVLTAWAAVEGRERSRGDGVTVLVADEGLAEVRLRSSQTPGHGIEGLRWTFARRGDRVIGAPGESGRAAGPPGAEVDGVAPLLHGAGVVGGVQIAATVPLTRLCERSLDGDAWPGPEAEVCQPHLQRLLRDWLGRHGTSEDRRWLIGPGRAVQRADGRATMEAADRLGRLAWEFEEDSPEFACTQALCMQLELAAIDILDAE